MVTIEHVCRQCGATSVLTRQDLVLGTWRFCPTCRMSQRPGRTPSRRLVPVGHQQLANEQDDRDRREPDV